MGGNDNSCSVIPIHRCDQIADVRDALRVQTVDRLIQNQNFRIAQHGVGDAKALFHAHGKRTKLCVCLVQAHQPQNTLRFAPVPNALHLTVVFQIFLGGQIVEKVFSDEETDLLPAAPQVCFCAFPCDGKLTVFKISQTKNDLENCGLARAVFSNQSVNLSLLTWRFSRIWGFPKIQKQGVSAESRNALFFRCGCSPDVLAALLYMVLLDALATLIPASPTGHSKRRQHPHPCPRSGGGQRTRG